MGSLEEFGKRIETEFARGEGGNEALMAEIQQRHARFQEIATRLMSQVIQPRAEKLVSYFYNAKPTKSRDPLHYSCRFGYPCVYAIWKWRYEMKSGTVCPGALEP